VAADGSNSLEIDEHLRLEVAMLKELTWVYVIEAPALVSQQFGQRKAIRELFRIYSDAATDKKTFHLFPKYYREALESASGDTVQIGRTVIDLIAGMTERQALAMHNRLTGISVGSGLEDIVP
jgi:dGTPase